MHIWEAFLNGDLAAMGSAIAGGVLGGAQDALKEKFKEWTGYDTVEEWLKDLPDDFLPDYSTYEKARETLDELAKNFKEFGDEVVKDIGDAINDALDTGVIPEQTDGGLGETHDIFTPESDAPEMPVGELPGMGTPETGMDRDGGGGAPAHGGGGSSGGDSPPPLGGTGEENPPPPASTTPPPPSAEDLGLPPGSYVEVQPTAGQIVITYPDGSTEVRPWP